MSVTSCEGELEKKELALPDGEYEIKIVDSKKDENEKYVYKISWTKTAWKTQEAFHDYKHLVAEYWENNGKGNVSKSSFPTQSKKTVNNNDANVIVLRRVESDIEDTEIVDISNPPEDDVDSKDCVSDQDMMAVVKDELSIPVVVEQGSKRKGRPLKWVTRSSVETNASGGDITALSSLVCSLCDVICLTNMDYKKHWADNHPNKQRTFKCEHCSRIFQKKQKLKEHIVCHSGERPYACDLCDKTYIYQKNLTDHKKRMHPNVPCSICNQRFPNQESLNKHASDVHNLINLFQCGRCKEFFKLADEYKQHTKECSSQYTCATCPKSFVNRSDCRMHEKIHDGTNPHHCEECDKYFLKRSKLIAHMEIHNKKDSNTNENSTTDTEEAQFVCETCNKSFKLEKYLKSHQIIHEQEAANGGRLLKFVCKTCYVSYDRLTHLKRHLQESTSCFSVECSICSQKFQSKKRLSSHAKLHTDRKSFKCETCQRAFGHKTDLLKHERSHSVDKQFSCELCNKKFLEKWLLRAHMEWHTTGRHPFQCPICDKILGKTSKLQEHIRCVHFKERDYICDTCGKEYSSKTDLLKHMKLHEDENESGNLKCEICQADGFTAATLEEHHFVHMRVQMNSGEVLDFDNVNQNRDFFGKENSSDGDEDEDVEMQEGEILISPRSPADQADVADQTAKVKVNPVPAVNFPLTLASPVVCGETDMEGVSAEPSPPIETQETSTVEEQAAIIQKLILAAQEDIAQSNANENPIDASETTVDEQPMDNGNVQIITTSMQQESLQPEEETNVQIVTSLPSQIDESDIQIVTTIHLETDNNAPISNELLQRTVQQLLMAAQESQQQQQQ